MLDYQELNDLLQMSQSDTCAADCHGFLSGQICVADFPVRDVWEQYLDLKSEDVKLLGDCFHDIDTLVAETISMLESPELIFHPLLPADDMPLVERADALSEWCHGFLNGFATAQEPGATLEDEDSRELIENFTRICQLEVGDQPGEDDERALFELVEYVRLGAIFIYGQFNRVVDGQRDPGAVH